MTRITVLSVLMVFPHITSAQDFRDSVSDLALTRLMADWEKEVKLRISKDESLKALAAKHSFALVHRRIGGEYRQSAYSFVYESVVPLIHRGHVHIVFEGDSRRSWFQTCGDNPLLVRLSKEDFIRGVDPKKIAIDHPDIITHRDEVEEGRAYLLRIRDVDENDFFVMFQTVALDPYGRYMAFLWRTLPGGRPIVRKMLPSLVN